MVSNKSFNTDTGDTGVGFEPDLRPSTGGSFAASLKLDVMDT